MNALGAFLLCPLHLLQYFLLHFTHTKSTNLLHKLEQKVGPMTGGGEMTAKPRRGSSNRERRGAVGEEAVEQLEEVLGGRGAVGQRQGEEHKRENQHQNHHHQHQQQHQTGDQNETNGHAKSSQLEEHRHRVGEDHLGRLPFSSAEGRRESKHGGESLPHIWLRPNQGKNCDHLAHLCHVTLYRKIMQRECQTTCGRDECQDVREDLCVQWARRNFCALRFYASMRWRCARTCRLCVPQPID